MKLENILRQVRILKHYEAFSKLSEMTLEESTVVLMNKKLNNMINFRSKHSLIEDQQLLTDTARNGFAI